jgi:hypothetical protein
MAGKSYNLHIHPAPYQDLSCEYLRQELKIGSTTARTLRSGAIQKAVNAKA